MKAFRTLNHLAVLGALWGVSGCEINSSDTKVQWMPDMADGPTVKAQEDFLDPPDNVISAVGILYPKTPEEAEKVLTNPLPSSELALKKGEHLYTTFCTVCHGPDAKGGGSIVDVFPRPPDITVSTYKSRADGFFFHRITFGSALMPSYGHAISPDERWAIVHYLRTLQK